ncbi:quinol dehydrogenase ferredoxin subunit NapH [Shewanella gelidii]|uniref:Quinol dehydrogenase ferredoxin subunit NapH n=1 Tax=Shewanella gelidii TaxID=1642821 RepID=A0A917JNN7_9GAMM|nr:quinol dehydrogenase ferredoxin subunit NapH [Shewanella gelidii]MCL1097865.1 quinol dehydrogenase ferredoxin subunit NapH [Shewanella gelidii]GGI78149.1 quinol dehydrogenase ferredoxin subunit NapH [Shewanella gelidii]
MSKNIANSQTKSDKFAQAAVDELGWWGAHKFLILRRLSQLLVLALFAIGPWFGLWFFKGNLSSSELLGVIPLTDPLVTMQVLLTGHWPEVTLLIGAAIIIAFYAVVGGRTFCSWVCPVNIITDCASWIRRKLKLPRTSEMPRNLRYYLLALVLILPILTGFTVWEWANPVPIVYRAILFSAGSGLWILAAIFLLDLLVVERAWCSHLCPTGAMFSLIGKTSPIKVSAVNAEACDNCMDCFTVCPERQVLKPVLKKGSTQPMIMDSDCTLCGRCIDVCAPRVFQYKNRFQQRDLNRIALKAENNQ